MPNKRFFSDPSDINNLNNPNYQSKVKRSIYARRFSDNDEPGNYINRHFHDPTTTTTTTSTTTTTTTASTPIVTYFVNQTLEILSMELFANGSGGFIRLLYVSPGASASMVSFSPEVVEVHNRPGNGDIYVDIYVSFDGTSYILINSDFQSPDGDNNIIGSSSAKDIWLVLTEVGIPPSF
jgi:hypothetical protein